MKSEDVHRKLLAAVVKFVKADQYGSKAEIRSAAEALHDAIKASEIHLSQEPDPICKKSLEAK